MKNTLIVLTLILFTSCLSDDSDTTTTTFEPQTDEDIQAYIAANNLNATKTSSGLYYVIDEVGTGENPISTDNVTVAYKGYFLDGSIFDQSSAAGISFDLQGVIAGWTEGITYFNEGGSGILLIPSNLGYGDAGIGDLIPGGAVLVFDINLISIN